MTAADVEPAVSRDTIGKAFKGTGLSMQILRHDRIVLEVFDTEDPIHLIRLFGIINTTAIRSVKAAHPERSATLPQ